MKVNGQVGSGVAFGDGVAFGVGVRVGNGVGPVVGVIVWVAVGLTGVDVWVGWTGVGVGVLLGARVAVEVGCGAGIQTVPEALA